MSRRFSNKGRLIQADKPIKFHFNGVQFTGYQGDTLASALLANVNYCLGVHLNIIGREALFLPDQRNQIF